MRGKARKRRAATGAAVWFQTILMRKIFFQAPVHVLGTAIVASGFVRVSHSPSTFVHTGNGIYEKTPRCPRGRSVHCWRFCTGTRSSSCPSHCACSSPHGRSGSCAGSKDQSNQDRQEKEDPQKGRQEENRPQGSLKQSGTAWRTRNRGLGPSLIQNRPLLRAFSLALLPPPARRQNFLHPLQSVVIRHVPC